MISKCGGDLNDAVYCISHGKDIGFQGEKKFLKTHRFALSLFSCQNAPFRGFLLGKRLSSTLEPYLSEALQWKKEKKERKGW